MVNLLGDRWQHGEPRFALAREVDGAHLHLYGKREARAGRKMGHLTMVGDDTDSVLARARALRASMTLSDGSGAPR
jgi:5-(carboxyamino)imidazole ribonucleotide synthase